MDILRLTANPFYLVFSENAVSQEGLAYTAYGIEARDEQGILCRLRDIAPRREPLFFLAERMNRGGMSLLHFKEVVMDFLLE
ncbi:MAG: hypothetical protein GXW99_03845 [Clostridiales bacterium]|nr:hypothetical protein [Clostridiales bacterium]